MYKKSIAEMMGDASREIGILIFVFYPITRNLHYLSVSHSLILSLGFFLAGVFLERMRN